MPFRVSDFCLEEQADEGLAGTHCPFSPFAVVLVVFLGKEGSLQMLTGCVNRKGLETSLLFPQPTQTPTLRILMGELSVHRREKPSSASHGRSVEVLDQRPCPDRPQSSVLAYDQAPS